MILRTQKFRILTDLIAQYEVLPDRKGLLSERRDGRWVNYSSRAIARSVRFLALGLHEMGVTHGTRVGILAAPSPFWVIYDLAVLSLGGISVPFFPTTPLRTLAGQMEESNVRVILLGSRSDYDRVQPILPDDVCALVRGDAALGDGEHVFAYDDTIQRGRDLDRAQPRAYATVRMSVEPNDLATILYTSGSTGKPKGVELTHQNLLSQTQAAEQRFTLSSEDDVALSMLPLAHVFERMIAYLYLRVGVPVYFADDIKSVATLMQSVRPTIMTVVPRVLEKIHDRITDKVEAHHGVRGYIGRMALGLAEHEGHRRWDDIAERVFDRAVYKAFRSAMGGRLRVVVSGGAPLSASLAWFYCHIGVPIYNGYGMTEASPVIAVNYPGENRIGSVGQPFPGVNVRIASDGEILVSGPGVMRGYHRRPMDTREAFTRNGWMRTGDLGRLDNDGYLYITGRKKELFKTSTGKYVRPVPIEMALSANRYIDSCMLIAEGRKYVSALLFLGDDSDASDRAVQQAVQTTVERLNASLPPWERIRRYRLISETPTCTNELLTPTAKIRRGAVERRYATHIDGMYAEA